MVWSNPEIKRLSREFVTVAEEVYFLYPEDPHNLERVKNDPAHVFFKAFGRQVPPQEWNERGTKQGIYMIGPNAEYLEAQFATAPGDVVLQRMHRALQRWEQLRREKRYANLPVPAVETKTERPALAGSPMLFQVNLRDLPRGADDRSGARFEQVGNRNSTQRWEDFTKWAWNENWIAFDDPTAWITDSAERKEVRNDLVRRLAREVLVDNVRGQAGPWNDGDVKEAFLTVRRTAAGGGVWTLEYAGRARMEQGPRRFDARIYGQGKWNARENRFEDLTLLAAGPREGAWTFNNRREDLGPAPMGISLVLWKESAAN